MNREFDCSQGHGVGERALGRQVDMLVSMFDC